MNKIIFYILLLNSFLNAHADEKIIHIDFFIFSKNGVNAINPAILDSQIQALNFWYADTKLVFKKRAVRILDRQKSVSCGRHGEQINPEDYFQKSSLQIDLVQLSYCFAPYHVDKGIVVFILNKITDTNGISSGIFNPIHNASSQPAVLALSAEISGTFGGFTFVHEIGHVLGLNHTLTSDPSIPVGGYRLEQGSLPGCLYNQSPLNFSYPVFRYSNLWNLTEPVHSIHSEWPGFKNIMGIFNWRSLSGISLFRGRYGEVFKNIIQCWSEISFSSKKHNTLVNRSLFASSPFIFSSKNGIKYLVYRGADNYLKMNKFKNGQWSHMQNLGGVLSSSPSLTSSKQGRVEFFIRGMNKEFYTRTLLENGHWTPWTSIGGSFLSAPTALTDSKGKIYILGVGMDQYIWKKTYESNVWSEWSKLPLTFPVYFNFAASFDSNGKLHIFFHDSIQINKKILHAKDGILNNSLHEAIDGQYRYGGLAAISNSYQIKIFVRSIDNAYWTKTFNTQTEKWSEWIRIGGSFTSAPTVTRNPDGSIELFGRGDDGNLWNSKWTLNQGWSTFSRVSLTDIVSFYP